MDELIIRSLQGNASEPEERQLAHWRQDSAARDQHVRQVRRLWELGEGLENGADAGFVPTIQELERRAETRSTPTPPRRKDVLSRRHRFLRHTLKAAALLVVGLGIGYLISSGRQAPPPLGAAEFVTGATETVTVTLGDGTLVRLAPESRLRLTGAAGDREVWLDGRAYFAVTRQDDRRFRVRTHAGDALVLGTRFDLQARNGGLRALVVEGSVELSSRGQRVPLAGNQTARITDDAPAIRETVDDDYVRAELEWMGDFLVFENTPLGQAARELSAHYGVPIEVLDSALARETVHGWFANEELEDVLGIICRAVRAHCTVRASEVTIEP